MEVMLAGAVLIIGLMGITQLIVYGMGTFRSAAVQAGAQLQSQADVAQFLMTPYGALTDGTFDAGTVVDVDGRTYSRLFIVSPAGDGGAIGTRRVEVRTTWVDAAGQQRQAVAVGLISEKPDANY